MRLFIALNLPEAERRAIFEATAPMREAARHVGWTPERNLHLTLKFLGEQPGDAVPALDAALGELAARHRPVEIELGGLGAFPNLRAPRIVWLGMTHEPRLELLQHDVETACAALGYPVEGRAFRPHITLGRVKRELAGGEARALADAARAVRYRGTSAVDAVDLMASTLAAGGSRYELVASLPLGPR